MSSNAPFELTVTRLIAASPEKVYEAWTNPELLPKWFTPAPWRTEVIAIEPETGGRFDILMKGPEGEENLCQGIFLEAIPGRRLVTTDAYHGGWIPSEKPFMTTIVTFEPEDGKTRYTARVRHWTKEDLENHEQMGFHEGWGQCAAQLANLTEDSKLP